MEPNPPAQPPVVPAGLPTAPPPGPQKKKTPWLLIIGLLVGVPLVLCLGVAGLGAAFVGTAKETALRPGDLDALVTAADLLAATGQDAEVDPKLEVTGRKKYIDGSVDLSYEYEQKDPPMYVSTSVTLEKNADDARTSFLTTSAGGGLGVAVAGGSDVKLEDRPGLLKWGDQSKTQILMASGKPAGNFIVVRKGTHVFMTTFAGVYYDDAQALTSLLEPKLEAMMRLERE